MASIFRLDNKLNLLRDRYSKLSDIVNETTLSELNQKLSTAQENYDIFSTRVSSTFNRIKSFLLPFSVEFKLRKICAKQLQDVSHEIERVEKDIPSFCINPRYMIRKSKSDSDINKHSMSYTKVFQENNFIKDKKVREAEDVINKLNNFYLPRKVI